MFCLFGHFFEPFHPEANTKTLHVGRDVGQPALMGTRGSHVYVNPADLIVNEASEQACRVYMVTRPGSSALQVQYASVPDRTGLYNREKSTGTKFLQFIPVEETGFPSLFGSQRFVATGTGLRVPQPAMLLP